MKSSVLSILFLALAFNLSACGKSGSDSANLDPVSNFLSGPCGSQVVDDYNSVVIKCKYMSSDASAKDCKSMAQSFQSKYPGINCEARAVSTSSLTDTPMTITSAKIQSVIDNLTALGY